MKKVASIAESKWRFDYKWFISQVNHKAPWDIKREESWNKTIGENTYPGWGIKVKYNGNFMTPEELGNYAYGYIGAAMGLSIVELYAGSWVAAGFPMVGTNWDNEYNDWTFIEKGVQAYKN